MGVVKGITATEWPEQTDWLHGRVKVCFDYDPSQFVLGTIVRDDKVAPSRTIIRLDDGRHVLGTECQYSPPLP